MTITEFLEARLAEDECAAKRAITSLHAAAPWEQYGEPTEICGECGDWWDGSPIDYPCDTIKIIASTYESHPDYQREWAL